MNLDLSFIDLKTVFIILHLIGVALGVGGAYMSDFMFMNALKDKIFENTEIRYLQLGSTVVWLGLVILIVSGTGLFFLDPVKYMHSTKFLSKMIIVAIITFNGAIFYYMHMKHLLEVVEKNITSSVSFRYYSVSLYVSGAVSMVSWTFALILGAFKSIPYSIAEIMTFYGFVVACGMIGALVAREMILRK